MKNILDIVELRYVTSVLLMLNCLIFLHLSITDFVMIIINIYALCFQQTIVTLLLNVRLYSVYGRYII